jgi:hypothetical protein
MCLHSGKRDAIRSAMPSKFALNSRYTIGLFDVSPCPATVHAVIPPKNDTASSPSLPNSSNRAPKFYFTADEPYPGAVPQSSSHPPSVVRQRRRGSVALIPGPVTGVQDMGRGRDIRNAVQLHDQETQTCSILFCRSYQMEDKQNSLGQRQYRIEFHATNIARISRQRCHVASQS